MVIIACTLTITSCSKKSDLIIGQWTNTEASYQILEDNTKEVFPAGTIVFTFLDNNTCLIHITIGSEESGYYHESDAEMDYTVEKDKLILSGNAIDMPQLDKKNLVLDIKSHLYAVDWEEGPGTGSTHLEMEKVQ